MPLGMVSAEASKVVLRVANEDAIEPAIVGRLDAVKPEEDLPAIPSERDLKLHPVAPGGIVISRDPGRINGEGVLHIGVTTRR